jgi:hypothetical protein
MHVEVVIIFDDLVVVICVTVNLIQFISYPIAHEQKSKNTGYITSFLVAEDTSSVMGVLSFERASEEGSKKQGNLISFWQQLKDLPHPDERLMKKMQPYELQYYYY